MVRFQCNLPILGLSLVSLSLSLASFWPQLTSLDGPRLHYDFNIYAMLELYIMYISTCYTRSSSITLALKPEWHVSSAKHSYVWLPDRQTPDKVIPLRRYASQATQKIVNIQWDLFITKHCALVVPTTDKRIIQTSSEEKRPWSSSPLIVSLDFFSPWSWARFQTGGALPYLVDVFVFLIYCFLSPLVCVIIFMASPLWLIVGPRTL